MNRNLSLNPYFDPDPKWYFYTLYVVCFLSIVIYTQAVYVILKHSPKIVAKSFKHQLIGHLTTATVFQLSVTVLCPILVYLPFVAGEGMGLMTYFGIGIDHQIVLLFTSVLAATAIILPLFYHRMRCLLPDEHFFNWKSVHYSLNTFVYAFSHILPIPPIYLSIYYQDSNEVKKYYEETYEITFPNLYSPQVVAIIMNNPWARVCTYCVFLACIFFATVIFGCSYMSYRTLKKTSSISLIARKHHINLLKSLAAMIIIFGGLIVIVIPVLACFFVFNSPRSDIAHMIIIMGSMAVPIAMIAYFINYKPYRQYYLKKIYRLFNINRNNETSPHLTVGTFVQ